MDIKAGSLGNIKDLVRKANECPEWPLRRTPSDAESKTSNEGTPVRPTLSGKKSASADKDSKGKRSGTSKKSSTASKKDKKLSAKQEAKDTKPRSEAPVSNSSADNGKVDKTPLTTVGSLESLWNAAKASKAKALKKEGKIQV